jgi:hypothetical protein
MFLVSGGVILFVSKIVFTNLSNDHGNHDNIDNDDRIMIIMMVAMMTICKVDSPENILSLE